MDRLNVPTSFEGPNKKKQIQDAKDMYQTVVRLAERANTHVPPYQFIELIGKGSFGRVYKCHSERTGTIVAVKIISVDDSDFTAHTLDKDETLKDFRKEVSILHQLKEKKAQNVNMIHEAFDLHSQLWIVSDYCTGGSVRTLMRQQPTAHPGLEELYIIPVARELALALKSVHEIGVIHRDIKATNVYVTEDGRIQLGDFGIVGVPEDGKSKRTTIVGTPHYMPLEFHTTEAFYTDEAYGTEVDVWSFGITVYEMAVGHVPNPRVGREDLGEALQEAAPRLPRNGNYSDTLRDFVAFCLDSNPQARPSITEVLQHSYIAGTELDYPTSNLIQLIERYTLWEFRGGQRSSLWMAGGAEAPSPDGPHQDNVGDFDDWNFSTSDDFNENFGRRYSQMIGLDLDDATLQAPEGSGLPPINTQNITGTGSRYEEYSAERGERSLDRLWNSAAEPYKLHTPIAPSQSGDLPLRSTMSSAPRESIIDLDSAGSQDEPPTFNFDFEDLATVKAKHRTLGDEDEGEGDGSYPEEDDQNTKRATRDWRFPAVRAEDTELKRATMDWTFPTTTVAAPGPRATMEWSFSTAGPARDEESSSPEASMNLPPPGNNSGTLAPGFRPQLRHMATEPIGNFGDYMHTTTSIEAPVARPLSPARSSMIDLDLDFDGPQIELPELIHRPSTASSTISSAATDTTSGNPFDLEEDPDQRREDRNRFSSQHRPWRSEDHRSSMGAETSLQLAHARMQSSSSSDSEFERERSSHERQVAEAFAHNLAKSRAAPALPADRGHYLSESEAGFGAPASNGRTAAGFRGEVEFPTLRLPAMEAFEEGADPAVLAAEMDRVLAGLEAGLLSTASALGQHAGLEEGDEWAGFSGGESGYTSREEDEGF